MVYFGFVCLLKIVLFRINFVTATKNVSVLFYKNLKSSFSTWLTHWIMRFLYILGCSDPRCGLAGRHLTHHMQDIIPNGYSLRSWQPTYIIYTVLLVGGKRFFYWKHRHNKKQSQVQSDQCKIQSDSIPISSNQSIFGIPGANLENSSCTVWVLLFFPIPV